MRRLVILLIFASPPLAVADEAERAREMVRAALLDAASLPPPPEMPAAQAEERKHPRLPIDPEHEAHRRAVEHGERHSREAQPGHRGAEGSAGPHGASGMPGMDPGGDCHDAAGNMRTRGTHDGGMGPGHQMGMQAAPGAATSPSR